MDDVPGSRALAQHAAACGVRVALGVYLAGSAQSAKESAQFKKAMRDAGLNCGILFVEPAASRPNLESFEFGGLVAMTAYLQRHPTLPDLIHFSDDFLARGGLTALHAAGKRIPEDVQVTTLANHGNHIAFPKALTCLEADPAAVGALMAQLAIHALDRPQRKKNVTVAQTRLVLGESTVLKKPEPVAARRVMA
jgi:DNA-binding LacI/PurR family transcriptional regulator